MVGRGALSFPMWRNLYNHYMTREQSQLQQISGQNIAGHILRLLITNKRELRASSCPDDGGFLHDPCSSGILMEHGLESLGKWTLFNAWLTDSSLYNPTQETNQSPRDSFRNMRNTLFMIKLSHLLTGIQTSNDRTAAGAPHGGPLGVPGSETSFINLGLLSRLGGGINNDYIKNK